MSALRRYPFLHSSFPFASLASFASRLWGSASFAAGLWGLTFLASATCFAQADYEREKRWAEQITPAILVGDALYLELKSGRKFLAIYTPKAQAKAGVVVVHGLGVNPDWGLINPLRTQLPEQGYATLSVQMPVRAAEAGGNEYPPVFPEAAERLATAVAFLRGKGYKRVAIVSHSMGSRMTNHFLNTIPDPRIDAWVAIGISGVFTEPASFKAPVLDLFGENDSPAVLKNAEKRAAALKGVRGSAQIQASGADHFFKGQEAELVRLVRQFLDRTLK
jgi:pimeloyl-ACP methyl ester carboxylesterase